jgi:hypothetical protein
MIPTLGNMRESRKTPEIARTWKQYSGRNVSGNFRSLGKKVG